MAASTFVQVQISAEVEAMSPDSHGWEGIERVPSPVLHWTDGETWTQREEEDACPESARAQFSHNEVRFTTKVSQAGKSLNCLCLGLLFRDSWACISVVSKSVLKIQASFVPLSPGRIILGISRSHLTSVIS